MPEGAAPNPSRYVGSLSFFGAAGHAGHEGHQSRSVVFDVSDVLDSLHASGATGASRVTFVASGEPEAGSAPMITAASIIHG